MQITTVPASDSIYQQMAHLLVVGFRVHWDAWKTDDEALEEVHMVEKSGFVRVALSDDGTRVLGWIGGLPEYDGNVWELHPLVVDEGFQMQGIGRALVVAFEAEVKVRGGLSIRVGSDDEDDMTSLANTDLYHNLWEKIAAVENFKGHPYEFYQRLGYTITGVVPDANGRGKPDIILGKRVE